MSSRKRVHILSKVNAANVSKDAARGTYLVRDVCGAVDEIVMNGMLYPGPELAAGAPSLDGKPAPAGHPKNEAGQFISASSGDALLSAYAGAVCRNARHEGGRTLCDIAINEAQARAHPDGAKLIERLDAAISGTNAEPIHVSTGVLLKPVAINGESRGRKYTAVATDLQYDHLAFLLHEQGAGQPADGVGMFLNAAGAEEPVESVVVNLEPEDKRSKGLTAWLNRLIFRRHAASELSFDQIRDGLWRALYETAGDGSWVQEVYDRYAIWQDRDGKLWQQDYSIASDGSVAWSGTAQEVRREVSYVAITNLHQQETDSMKELMVAALNAAGVKTEGLNDAAILAAYQQLAVAPVQGRLDAANSKIAEHEAAARAAEEAEVSALATELAVNGSLTVDDLKRLGKARLTELKAKAAPIVVGSSAGTGDKSPYADYDPNVHFDAKKEAA